MPPPPPDRNPAIPWQRLSAGEREVLALLAEGHTAKSIAAALDISVHAVNERLREARRKTGVGSSREVARLLRTQENRDEQIGVEAAIAVGDASNSTAPIRAGGQKPRIIAMSAIAAIVVAAAVLAAGQDRGADASSDPILAALLDKRGTEPRELYARIRSEPRDAEWAEPHETALRTRYRAVPGVLHDRLRVICAATLCEVAGVIEAGSDGRPLLALQRLGFDNLGGIGLASESFAVGGRPPVGDGSSFVAYLMRSDSIAPHVTGTTPRQGAVIPAGEFALSVTFDLPMRGTGYSFVTADRGLYPDCDKKPRQSRDGRTFAMTCRAGAGRGGAGQEYAVGFNGGTYRNFVSRAGVPATPAVLRFRTAPDRR